MSKVGLSALTRIQQQDFDKTPDTDCVANHVHPGYVKTDMNNHKGPLPSTKGHGPPSMQHFCHPIQTSG